MYNEFDEYGFEVETVPKKKSKKDISADLSRLIGKNQRKYKEIFREMDHAGNKSSWNWCAFLFPDLWCLYRKMYTCGGILFLGLSTYILVLNNLLNYLNVSGLIKHIIVLLMWIIPRLFTGLYLNGIYYNRLKRIINEARPMPSEEKNAFYRSKGGTSIVGPLLVAVMQILYGFITLAVLLYSLTMH